MYLFTNNMIIYVEKSKRIDKSLLELINEYNKFSGYQVDIEKSVTCLYTSNEQVKFEITNTIPFALTTPPKEVLGINLIKYVQDLYNENYKDDGRKIGMK